MRETISCEFCSALNPLGAESCSACGAPLPHTKPGPARREGTTSRISKFEYRPSQQRESIQRARHMGEKVDKAASTAFYIYSLFWRTLAEAIAIAITGFAIGLVGGATGMALWGVVGAATVGIVVGFTIKIYYFTIISAPAGIIAGAVFCVLLWVLGAPPSLDVFVLTLFTSLAAYIGGSRSPYRHRNWWEKIRPLLGAIGGLISGLLGMGIGVGIQAAVAKLLG